MPTLPSSFLLSPILDLNGKPEEAESILCLQDGMCEDGVGAKEWNRASSGIIKSLPPAPHYHPGLTSRKKKKKLHLDQDPELLFCSLQLNAFLTGTRTLAFIGCPNVFIPPSYWVHTELVHGEPD